VTIKARYPGTCTKCKGRILIGQKIDWIGGGCASHNSVADCDLAKMQEPLVAVNLDVTLIVAFLQAAHTRGLKHPRARFLSPSNREMRLSLVGPGRRAPVGSVLILIEGEFIGVVEPSGAVSGRLRSQKPLQELLIEIAKDPAGAAHAYGALMGRCSFCNLPITDAGSVEVGYGPICAASYGLPWVRLGVPVLEPVLDPLTTEDEVNR